MIDKITAKIRRYPFQTGIIVGVIVCLLLAGFFSLFQDHGRTLAGNSEIIQEDYLRMSINEYSQNQNEALALWRYEHLGNKADQTLKYMIADESVSPVSLAEFADAIGKTDKIGGAAQTRKQVQAPEGTPTNPRKGLSGVGKVLLIIVGVVVVAAGCLYAASLIKTKNKQKRRSEKVQNYDDSPVNIITPDKAQSMQENTPDTLFDLDSLFPQNEGEKKESEDIENSNTEIETEITTEEKQDTVDETENVNAIETEDKFEKTDDENIDESNDEPENVENPNQEFNSDDNSDAKEEITSEESTEVENDIVETAKDNDVIVSGEIDDKRNENIEDVSNPEPEHETRQVFLDEAKTEEMMEVPEENNEGSDKNVVLPESDTENIDEEQKPTEENNVTEEPLEETENNTEKPLVETDPENETDNVDELLKMIRAGNTPSDNAVQKVAEIDSDNIETVNESETEVTSTTEADVNSQTQEEAFKIDDETAEPKLDDDVLIHYQSQYRIGNDMYDEVFSIDQGDVFRGECGIGIGETLNNTEPKAVTAFEVWLFDKDDIHTATWYLMSDFALSNEGISQRLAQRGKCDRIRKGDLYTLETETLVVDIKILELEYGSEMEEKNSYFTNVVFDVIARQKNGE